MNNQKDQEEPWLPIESDPDIMTEFVQSLTKSNSYLIDVPIIEGAEEMGLFLNHNVTAFIFLYTINEKTESNLVGELLKECPNGIFHMKQINKNACGTVALFHSFLNADIPLVDRSLMADFVSKTTGKNYLSRGEVFSGMTSIKEMHENFANFGQSDLPSEADLNNVKYHYVAIIPHKDHVYELDGRKPFPIKHFNCQKQSFVHAGLLTIQSLIQRDPDNYKFSILAFCKPS